jgi:hypothetical protein
METEGGGAQYSNTPPLHYSNPTKEVCHAGYDESGAHLWV